MNYISKGSDSMEEKFFNIKKLDENGDVTLKQVEPAIYMKDDDFCYVDPNDFSSEDVLVSPDTNETLALSQLEKAEIDGVYCVNQGITNFRYIDEIFQDNEYTIVRSDVDYSIARYDRIILNQTMVKENQIIK